MNQPKTLFFLFLIFIYVTPVNSGTQIQVTTSESFTFSRINAADVRNYIYFSVTGNVNYLSYDTAVKHEEKAEDQCKKVRDLLRNPLILLNEPLGNRSGVVLDFFADRLIYNGSIWAIFFRLNAFFECFNRNERKKHELTFRVNFVNLANHDNSRVGVGKHHRCGASIY